MKNKKKGKRTRPVRAFKPRTRKPPSYPGGLLALLPARYGFTSLHAFAAALYSAAAPETEEALAPAGYPRLRRKLI